MSDDNKLDHGKEWNTPQLTTLVRNKPEEMVLTACKYVGMSALPGLGNTACHGAKAGACGICKEQANS